MKKFYSRGFTLIELLTVIAIMGVLYTIVFGNISNSKQRSRDDLRVSDIKEIQLALAQFLDGCSNYPTSLSLSAVCPDNPSTTFGDYIKRNKVDPSTGAAYYYSYTANPRSFCLGAVLEVSDPVAKQGNSGCYTGCAGVRCYSVKNP